MKYMRILCFTILTSIVWGFSAEGVPEQQAVGFGVNIRFGDKFVDFGNNSNFTINSTLIKNQLEGVLDYVGISIPVIVPGGAKLEPKFGLFHSSTSSESDGGSSFSSSSTFLELSLAISKMKQLNKAMVGFGGHFGLMRASDHSESSSSFGNPSSSKESQMNFMFGPQFSGEYFLSPNFSFGMDIPISFTYVGEPKSDDDTNNSSSSTSTSTWMIYPTASFHLRFYY